MTDSYYIDRDVLGGHPFSIVGHFLKCSKCGKKSVVEIALNGTDHNVCIFIHCAECMEISEDFKKNHSESAKKIEDFCANAKMQIAPSIV